MRYHKGQLTPIFQHTEGEHFWFGLVGVSKNSKIENVKKLFPQKVAD